MKVLVATEKPFSKAAVNEIKAVVNSAGHEFILLESYKEKKQLLDAVTNADALIIRSDDITREIMEAAPNLKIVVRAGAGYDNIDLEYATERGIVAMNTPGQNSNAVAELVVGMMIFMARNQITPGTGGEIMGKSVGIHAYGNVGRMVARKALALGMKVYAYDPFVEDASLFKKDCVEKVNSVEELYEKSDYISLHIPATPTTINSINYELLSRLPHGATIVNTARKEVIDEAGMMKILTERPDLKYTTDIAPDNKEQMKEKFGLRVFFTTKKLGAETAEANINAGVAAAKQIVGFFKSGDRKFQVNK